MDLKAYSQPAQLERYSFLWSEVRLLVAALALFLGGIPPVYYFIRITALFGLFALLLTVAWIVSGAAAVYLLYRWYDGKQLLFARKVPADTAAFFVLVISGINLGLTGIIRTNLGMSITQNHFIFFIVGLLYLVSAGYLYQRWSGSGKKLF